MLISSIFVYRFKYCNICSPECSVTTPRTSHQRQSNWPVVSYQSSNWVPASVVDRCLNGLEAVLDPELISEARDGGMDLGFDCWKCKSDGR